MSASSVIWPQQNKVVVGLAEMVVSNNHHVLLTASSLGSCLGIAIYDPAVRVSGMLHSMLPDSSINRAKAVSCPALFLDTGFSALLRAAQQVGAVKERLLLFVAGGAQVLDRTGVFNMGDRNCEALTRLLQEYSLRVHAQETGGLVNRTLSLNLARGEVRIKISGQRREKVLCKNWMTT